MSVCATCGAIADIDAMARATLVQLKKIPWIRIGSEGFLADERQVLTILRAALTNAASTSIPAPQPFVHRGSPATSEKVMP